MAHVDHGKTTLADHLIASNGLIHPKAVGEVRYLDHEEEEQLRGITMKSSSISLLHLPGHLTNNRDPDEVPADERVERGFLINLIDSPGHIDFCSEVSTAARLTDGCLVIVDAVEGVCIQTHAVLRRLWEEKVKPCLVINKLDRLILELNASPMEAYEKLQQIIVDVNMVMSAFESERFLNEANAFLAHEDAREAARGESWNPEDLEDDVEDVFDPRRGNVVFSSAYDGWGFRIQQFAEMYAQKLGASINALTQALWGQYYYMPKAKTVVKEKSSKANKGKPMFVQFVLEPIWNAYTACEPGCDVSEVLGKIVRGRKLLKVDLDSFRIMAPKKAVKMVLQAWLPLSEAVLGMVVEHLPSPKDSAEERITHLMSFPSSCNGGLGSELVATKSALDTSDSSPNAPLVIFVSKMVAVPISVLPRSPGEVFPESPTGDAFLAFGRVYSGVAKRGVQVHVIAPSYGTNSSNIRTQEAVLGEVYLMMGRGLEKLEAVPAGNVLAIAGLDHVISKSATVSSFPECPPLAPLTFQCAPIVRVAVEPALPSQMSKLEAGLARLEKADPFVEVEVLDSGEHVLGAAGEIHLATCLKQLRERFALIDLEVSPPLVAFRETIADPGEAPDRGVSRAPHIIEAFTPTGLCCIRVRAHPLPGKAASLLDDNRVVLRAALEGQSDRAHEVKEIGKRLKSVLEDFPTQTQDLFQHAWVLGPKQSGPNILLATNPAPGSSLFDVGQESIVQLDKKQKIPRSTRQIPTALNTPKKPLGSDEEASDNEDEDKSTVSNVSQQLPTQEVHLEFSDPTTSTALGLGASSNGGKVEDAPPQHLQHLQDLVKSGICSGFQLAVSAGPLCMEPMWGVAFDIETRLFCPVRHGRDEEMQMDLGEDVYGPFSGQVMTMVTAACRLALMESDPRLVEAMFLCEISSTAEALSGVYAVLGRRRSRVLREDMQEGSDMFIVKAYLPVEASFGLADELRNKTSGAASASLMLSHWERLQVDPFFVPTTEEEKEEFGEVLASDAPNLAKSLIFSVRKRKGLPVEEKVVESATKQRTRAKKV